MQNKQKIEQNNNHNSNKLFLSQIDKKKMIETYIYGNDKKNR